jgi:CHAD domain-containing protein
MTNEIGVEADCPRASRLAMSIDRTAVDEPSAAMVILGVLNQFSRNFLLNDSGSSSSSVNTAAPTDNDQWSIPHHHPCRGGSVEERIHQARISVRRMRSTIRTFENLMDPSWAKSITTELSWYGKVLGAERDLHVLRRALKESFGLVNDASQKIALLEVLDRTIDSAQERGDNQRTTIRYVRLVEEVTWFASNIQFAAKAEGPARDVLAPRVRSSWQDVASKYRDARKDTSDVRLHELRIAVKRLQYACETIGIVEGANANKFARRCGSLQTRLGSVHDASVAVEWLGSLDTADPAFNKLIKSRLDHFQDTHRNVRRGWRNDMHRVKRAWNRWHKQRRSL